MAIARKKPAEQKTPKSPTKVAKDAGLSSVKNKERLYKDGKEVSREEFIAWDPWAAEILEKVDAIKSGKKIVPSEKATKSSKDSKTAKNKSEDSQNGGKNTSGDMVKNSDKSPNGKDKGKPLSDSVIATFKVLEEYASEMVKKSRYAKIDPTKICLGIFFVLPECEKLTQNQFCEYFKLGINTPTRWKLDKDVIKIRNEFAEIHFRQYTPAIIHHLVRGAQKTSWKDWLVDVAAIKLFLQYVEKWNEKQEIDHTSDGKAISWGIAPSQFVRKENIPDQEADEEEDDDSED